MKVVTVLGIGSPFGADRLGLQVIEHFELYQPMRLPADVFVKLLACDRPGTMLLDYIKDANLAILVDAVHGGKSGKIRKLQADELMRDQQQISSHHVGVVEALVLGEKLNMLPQQVILYGIETGDNIHALKLTHSNYDRIYAQITTDIKSWLSMNY